MATTAIRFSAPTIALLKRHRADLQGGCFDPTLARAEDAKALAVAADEHRALMQPAPPDFVDRTLRGLRSATILKDETPAEADASFKILRAHLADVPADILQEACRRYVNHPGARFYPRSAGELRVFTGPLVHERMMRARRLRAMAEAAEEKKREAERMATPMIWTVEAVRDLRSFAKNGLANGWFDQALYDAAFPPDPPPDSSAHDAEREMG